MPLPLARILGAWVSRLVTWYFLVAIALPTAAPFQTVNFSGNIRFVSRAMVTARPAAARTDFAEHHTAIPVLPKASSRTRLPGRTRVTAVPPLARSAVDATAASIRGPAPPDVQSVIHRDTIVLRI